MIPEIRPSQPKLESCHLLRNKNIVKKEPIEERIFKKKLLLIDSD